MKMIEKALFREGACVAIINIDNFDNLQAGWYYWGQLSDGPNLVLNVRTVFAMCIIARTYQ